MNNKMPKLQTSTLREPNYVFQSHEIHPSIHQTVRKFLHNSKNFNKKFCSSTESGNSSQSRLRVVRAVHVTNCEHVTLPPSYQLSWQCTMYLFTIKQAKTSEQGKNYSPAAEISSFACRRTSEHQGLYLHLRVDSRQTLFQHVMSYFGN